jgi:hypothetical protein
MAEESSNAARSEKSFVFMICNFNDQSISQKTHKNFKDSASQQSGLLNFINAELVITETVFVTTLLPDET